MMNWLQTKSRHFWFTSLVLVTIASLAPLGAVVQPPSVTGIDKLVHFLMYFVLAVFPAAFLQPKRVGVILALAMILYGLLMEYFQGMLPYRSCSMMDFWANTAGVGAGIGIGCFIRKKQTECS